jgi:hypothetical protein
MFKPYDYEKLPQTVKDNLAIIDEAKQAINEALSALMPASAQLTHKIVHSYKLDFEHGKRVFKVAVVRKAQAKVAPKVANGDLGAWIAGQVTDGHAV